jgi:DNA-directed RNA polymerase specialized sigma24 family protein
MRPRGGARHHDHPIRPAGGQPDPGLAAIISERHQLINLAYRLLGSLTEAEDAVQEAYARWYAMTGQQQQAIDNPAAWLTRVTSRICLNLLGSADWYEHPPVSPAQPSDTARSHTKYGARRENRSGASRLGE